MHTAFIIYDVVNTSEDIVSIDISIGNGQSGNTLVRLEEKQIGDFDNSFTLDIGKGKEVVKKSLYIISTIHDINPDNNRITMQLEINGGKKPYFHTVIDSSVPQHGDSTTAFVTIAFI